MNSYTLIVLSLAFLLGTSAEQCGRQARNGLCPNGLCCSQHGWCGTKPAYCGAGCQSQCRPSTTPSKPTPTPAGGSVGSLLGLSLVNQLLKHRNDGRCSGRGFYTYDAFITAARSFGGFGTTGDVNTRKRELAAFLAQTSHETTGGWPEAEDGPYAWGYCFIREKERKAYCDVDKGPCPPGKLYYGRGPIQLTHVMGPRLIHHETHVVASSAPPAVAPSPNMNILGHACVAQSNSMALTEETFEPNYDNTAWPTILKNVQEWSYLQKKKHHAKKEDQINWKLLKNSCKSSPALKRTNKRVFPLNLNQEQGSGLLTPLGSMCKWKKPDFGWTKLNTDGSITPKRSGFGGLLRDHMGDPICAFASNAHGDDIFLVELWAIESGLRLALDMGIKVIWVESDSLSAVKTINNDQPFNQKAASCLKDIWRLLKKFEKYKVSHAWRETNRAADHLAKMALFESDYKMLFPLDFSKDLCKIIKDDLEGKIYCRGSNKVLWWKPKS